MVKSASNNRNKEKAGNSNSAEFVDINSGAQSRRCGSQTSCEIAVKVPSMKKCAIKLKRCQIGSTNSKVLQESKSNEVGETIENSANSSKIIKNVSFDELLIGPVHVTRNNSRKNLLSLTKGRSPRKPDNAVEVSKPEINVEKSNVSKETKGNDDAPFNRIRTRRSVVKLKRIDIPEKPTKDPVKSCSKQNSQPNTTEAEDVYDFVSQSSQETVDVTADVVKKLIKQGKVSVMHKNTKKRKRVQKARPANWKKIYKELHPNGPPKQTTKAQLPSKTETPKAAIPINDSNLFDYNEKLFQPTTSTPQPKRKSAPNNNQSFSKLAKSVMTRETSRSTVTPRKMVTNKKELLKVALNFVNHSTPNKSAITTPSPQQHNKTQSPVVSPWRVENELLPQTFYFSRNNDNLPSYSSDVIPSSQNILEPVKTPARNSTRLHDFSLNLSDIENISPVTTNKQEKSVNTRIGLRDRSPLKAIQILNVVNLPNVRTTLKDVSQDKDNKLSPLKSPNHNKTLQENKENSYVPDNLNCSDYFGFDETDYEQPVTTTNNFPNKKSLKAKLKKLKRLLPPKPTRLSYGTVRSIFTEERQPDIREMLSSTTISDNQKDNSDAGSVLNTTTKDDTQNLSPIPEQSVRLFDDLEPESSFDTSVKVKTYERFPKRTRKRPRHNFIMFSHDSESEQEDEEVKPKRQKKPNNKELKKFVTEFNSMCEEVDQYELVIEGDKSNADVSV